MSDNFDWQTEEESEWLNIEQAFPSQTAVSRTRWWPLLLIGFIGLGIAGSILFRQAKAQVAAVTADVEEEILTTHRLIQTAVARNDAELFHSQLSARDQNWLDTQDALMVEELLYQRPFYLLPFWLNEVQAAEDVTVTLSPDLREAEVQFPQVYQVGINEAESKEVVLWQTAVYRRGSKKWLLSPPLREFWGEWQTEAGQWLTVHFPTRDAQIAHQLANDLDNLITTLCDDLVDINCGADLKIELRLDTHPASLMALDDLAQTLKSGTRLEMPTPTLIGLPKDEQAYDLVFRSYAIQVATAVITYQTKYECCAQGLFFRTLLERQLAQLNLVQWPPVAIDHIDILDRWSGANYLSTMWSGASNVNRDSVYTQRFYPLIDMLEQEAGDNVSLVEMQRRLSQHNSLESWLIDLLGAVDLVTFETQLQQYIRESSATYVVSTPPYPLPAQQLQLQCFSSSGSEGIYHYDPVTDTWRTFLSPSAKDSLGFNSMTYTLQPGYLVTVGWQETESGQRQRIITVTKELATVVHLEIELEEFDDVWVDSVSQTDQFLTLFFYSVADSSETKYKYELVDLKACDGSNCERLPLPGRAVWSPNGRYTLLSVPQNSAADEMEMEIFLGDDHGQPIQFIGKGLLPFWLNDEQYLFLRQASELAAGSIYTATTTTLLTLNDLTPHLPPEDVTADLSLNLWGMTDLDLSPNNVLLYVRGAADAPIVKRSYFIMTLNPSGTAVEQVKMIHQATGEGWVTLSPDQRWITEVNYDMNTPDATINLYNLESGAVEALAGGGFSNAWSADSKWFVYNQGNVVVLLAPGTGFQHLTQHPFTDCWNMIWVDP